MLGLTDFEDRGAAVSSDPAPTTSTGSACTGGGAGGPLGAPAKDPVLPALLMSAIWETLLDGNVGPCSSASH